MGETLSPNISDAGKKKCVNKSAHETLCTMWFLFPDLKEIATSTVIYNAEARAFSFWPHAVAHA